MQTIQKKHYDKTTKRLPAPKPNDTVRYHSKQSWEQDVVLNHHMHPAPRSYKIRTAGGNEDPLI